MLDYLRIRGLALIDDLALELAPGMNVLTGETGAGKSIIVDSLALLRGARGRAELVRDGMKQGHVEAQFVLERGDPRLDALFGELEIDLEDGALVVGRSVNTHGRGRSTLQGGLTTLSCLGRVGEVLMDICSQHEHHSLTNVTRHIELLDSFAHLEEDLAIYEACYRRYRSTREELTALRSQAADRVQRLDFLRFQLEELERAQLDPQTYEDAKSRLVFLRDAQRWLLFAEECRGRLYESDDSVWGILSVLLERSRKSGEGSLTLDEIRSQLEAGLVAIEEAASAATRFSHELAADSGELEQLEEQISELEHLQRKHGCDVATLASRRDAMRVELEQLENADDRGAQLEARLDQERKVAFDAALNLRKKRKSAAKKLSVAIEAELQALHIPHARFDLQFVALSDDQLGPRGIDGVEFLFSANAGEALAPLHRVASGGELSRVLLAVKGVLSTGDCVVTYVFDEVDTGVGGAVAEAIGLRLKRTSLERQVLCVTHLPQIAAFAEQHFRVEKQKLDGRTVTRVSKLSFEERIEELARMLGGAKVTQSARDHAQALLLQGQAQLESKGASRNKRRPRSTSMSAPA